MCLWELEHHLSNGNPISKKKKYTQQIIDFMYKHNVWQSYFYFVLTHKNIRLKKRVRRRQVEDDRTNAIKLLNRNKFNKKKRNKNNQLHWKNKYVATVRFLLNMPVSVCVCQYCVFEIMFFFCISFTYIFWI